MKKLSSKDHEAVAIMACDDEVISLQARIEAIASAGIQRREPGPGFFQRLLQIFQPQQQGGGKRVFGPLALQGCQFGFKVFDLRFQRRPVGGLIGLGGVRG